MLLTYCRSGPIHEFYLYLPHFPYQEYHEVFDENEKLIDERYEKRVKRFLDEFEWFMEALKNQRETKGPSILSDGIMKNNT